LVERRDDPILWCYGCSTAIAQAEVETVEEPSRFHDIAFEGTGGRRLVISTTRPELLPACVALYVHPEDERYADLVSTKARVPMFGHEVEVRIHPDVDPKLGTGLMMVCTWGDMEDVLKWKEHDLATRPILDKYGRLNHLAGPFEGLSVKAAREKIVEALKQEGSLEGSRSIQHVVGVHDRCSTPVEFNHSLQWFVRVLDFKRELLRRSDEIRWYPPFMKKRFTDWVEGLKWDWCISRQRYYGVPFPVWFCKDCDEVWLPPLEALPVDPTVDSVPDSACCTCGSTRFVPDQDVMDTWMTSSLTPLINARWAYDDQERKKAIYPQSIRVQAYDIIRTWLFYTVVKSHFHTDSVPWDHVMISGWGLDTQGKKMSKSQGNFVEPGPVIKQYSADALRYWAAGSTLGADRRYSEEDVAAGRRLINKMWNASRLVSTHLFSEEDGTPHELKQGQPSIVDRWIRSRLASTIDHATEAFERYEYSHALAEVETFFFSDFCDNYLEIVKERFWKPEAFEPGRTEAARSTLHQVLGDILKLFAPFVPYITEELYQEVFRPFGGPVSIHAAYWPEPKASDVDPEAEAAVDLLVEILTSVRRWKTSQKVHANSALKRLVISAGDDLYRGHLESIASDLRAAARAEIVEIGNGGTVATDIEGIRLDLSLAEDR
jgi:valyl-tRNA synthetase